MFKNRILILGPAIDLNLIQRAEKMFEIQLAISQFFKEKEWIINDKIAIDIDNKEDTISKIVKKFKKEIRRYTILKDIPDDFLDNVSSSLVVYFLRYSDDSLIFRYILGRKTEISEYSELIIRNYETLIDALGRTVFQEFMKKMTDLLNAEIINVPDDKLSDELKEIFGSTIDIQIDE